CTMHMFCNIRTGNTVCASIQSDPADDTYFNIGASVQQGKQGLQETRGIYVTGSTLPPIALTERLRRIF
ncbi:MAG TPA: hypothetical protein VJB87_01750, partial [Candidatus Nanoarchaeia archaeon]|nr:hypothetical protein [Candidatus Nanoarchaeia archaeon]